MNLTDDEIRQLVSYAQGKFEAERYPFAPVLGRCACSPLSPISLCDMPAEERRQLILFLRC